MNGLAEQLPWVPLYSMTRSGLTEVSVYGLIYAWAEDKSLNANAGRNLIQVGNVQDPLWTRSLLKPFQLLALYPKLKRHYPELTNAHFAVMTASQNAEPEQLARLREIMQIGKLRIADLQCPACRGMSDNQSEKSALHHPCAGKHLAHLLFQKSMGKPLADYLQPNAPAYTQLKALLGYLLNAEFDRETRDGCGMPNYALNAIEIAHLYHALTAPISQDVIRQSPDEVTDSLLAWDAIRTLFQTQPQLIGGADRLDTRLMSEVLSLQRCVLAKEGADGLLAVGIGPQANAAVYPDGLGILIKLAHGYEPSKLNLLIDEILMQLGLCEPKKSEPEKNARDTNGLKTHFYFNVADRAAPHAASTH